MRTNDKDTADIFDTMLEADPMCGFEAFKSLMGLMERDGLWFGRWLLPTSIKPHFLPARVVDEWKRESEALVDVVQRTAQQLVSAPDALESLGFSSKEQELISIDPGYEALTPVVRPDVVWNGNKLSVLEINTDSPAMMTFADVLQNHLCQTYPTSELLGTALPGEDRTGMLRQTLLRCYHDAGGQKSDPTVAIIDWPNQKTTGEQRLTAKLLSAGGLPAFVCHPHELRIEGGQLTGQGRPIDIVQRRVLFGDFVEHADELRPLTEAYRRRLVCMVNPLRSYVAGVKTFLPYLRENMERLDDKDRSIVQRLISPTHLVTRQLHELLRDEPTKWVLKPARGHGSRGVTIGALAQTDEWEDAIASAEQGPWVAQRVQPVPRYRLPVMEEAGALRFERFYINWNPFLFLGEFAGAITRAGRGPVVSIQARGALLPAVAVQ